MRRVIWGWVVLAGIAGCSGNGGGTPDAGPQIECDPNPANVTADKIQTDIMAPRCVECHKFDGAGGTGTRFPNVAKLDLDTTAKTQASVGKASYYAEAPKTELKIVDPNNPANSTMYIKLLGSSPAVKGPKGENVGTAMPQGQTPLTDAQKKLMLDWICTGAK